MLAEEGSEVSTRVVMLTGSGEWIDYKPVLGWEFSRAWGFYAMG
jgi:hypothetical protein